MSPKSNNLGPVGVMSILAGLISLCMRLIVCIYLSVCASVRIILRACL